jgi:hypothetical protein
MKQVAGRATVHFRFVSGTAGPDLLVFGFDTEGLAFDGSGAHPVLQNLEIDKNLLLSRRAFCTLRGLGSIGYPAHQAWGDPTNSKMRRQPAAIAHSQNESERGRKGVAHSF